MHQVGWSSFTAQVIIKTGTRYKEEQKTGQRTSESDFELIFTTKQFVIGHYLEKKNSTS